MISLLAVSCTKDALSGVSESSEESGRISDYGRITAEALSTKTSLDGDGAVVWNTGDKIRIYGTSKPDGAVYVTESDLVQKAEFEAETDAVEDAVRYAVYPADAASSADLSAGSAEISLSGLAVQGWSSSLDETADIAELPMVAFSETDKFVFQNTCGGIRFSILDFTGSGIMLSSLAVEAKDNSQIAGTAVVDFKTAAMTLAKEGTANKVSVDFGEGLLLAPGGETEVNVFLPAGTYKGGFRFTATDTEGREFGAETNADITVSNGIVTPLKTLQLTMWYGTANCYVATQATEIQVDITPFYTFDRTFAAAGETMTDKEGKVKSPAKSAKIVWQYAHGSGNVVETVEISGEKLNVRTTGVKGNAVVAICDADGQVLWSYHIWATEVNDIPYHNDVLGDFVMMDRNLGATAVELKNQATYGNFYQWGRKDPMPRGIDLQRPAKPYTTPYDMVEAVMADDTKGTVAYAVAHPDVRIKGGDSWFNGELPALWKTGSKTVFDPCPAGYRVADPNCYENGWVKDGPSCNENYGYAFATGSGDYTSIYPTVGYLQGKHDSIAYLEYRARYWTSDPSKILNYNNTTVVVGDFKLESKNSYADGYAVRCMKIN